MKLEYLTPNSDLSEVALEEALVQLDEPAPLMLVSVDLFFLAHCVITQLLQRSPLDAVSRKIHIFGRGITVAPVHSWPKDRWAVVGANKIIYSSWS